MELSPSNMEKKINFILDLRIAQIRQLLRLWL